MASTDTTPTTRAVADAYFAAIAARDLEAALALWAPGGVERVAGEDEPRVAPDGVRDFVGTLLRAFPDAILEVVSRTVEDDRAAYRWVARGTFAGEPLQGIASNGARVTLEGVDLLRVAGGRIAENDVLIDMTSLLRQIGVLPAAGSAAEARVAAAVNVRTRAARALAATRPEQVADGVWLVRGGLPSRTMNVYLVRDGDGVLLFDGGIRGMAGALSTAAAQLGGITRVVLSHSHPDHRGAVPGLGDGVPVLVHEADRADAEGDGGVHYFEPGKLDPHGRLLLPRLLRIWDGGPVRVSGTLAEGDEVAGFRVVHLPGHAPGLISLWRETDRVALVSDVVYTLDPQTSRKGPPRVPHDAFNWSTDEARASLRKLAALEPFAAFPGHGDALKGDVRGQ